MKLRNLFFVITFLFAIHANAQQPAYLPQFKFFKLDGKAYSNVNINQSKKTLFILFDCSRSGIHGEQRKHHKNV